MRTGVLALAALTMTVVLGAEASALAKTGSTSAVGSLCGKPVRFSVDAATFTSGPAADDPAARHTAETRGAQLITKAFAALCAAKTLAPEEVGKRISRVRIAWAGGADDFTAYFAKNAPGMLLTEWIGSGEEVPDDADIRDGIVCAFRPKDKRCAARGP